MELALCHDDGAVTVAQRWAGRADALDRRVLAHVLAPVLDIGCGPARHTLALAEHGIVALGIDVTVPAVALARARGASVLHRGVFDAVPAAGRWGTALLLDGNIGIGGNPVALLRRVRDLVHADGRVLVELADKDARRAPAMARLDVGGSQGPWFAWCSVTVEGIDDVAAAAALRVEAVWSDSGHWFSRLVRA
jgi:SAM-dependent methyltransferase